MVGAADGELGRAERDRVRANAHRVKDDGRLDRRRAAAGLEPVTEPRERRALADPLVLVGDQREHAKPPPVDPGELAEQRGDELDQPLPVVGDPLLDADLEVDRELRAASRGRRAPRAGRARRPRSAARRRR